MANVGKQDSQKEYNKLRQKLIKEIEQGTQRGFIFPDDVLPPIPKTISHKHVEELKQIKPSTLYKNSEWVDHETGEVLAFKDISSDIYEAIGKAKQQVKAKSKSNISLSQPSIKDEVLTEEERKEVNKARGKKAWETRRANMTDEEYEYFRKTFATRMKQIREAKKPTKDYPKLSMVDAVGDKIEKLTRYVGDTHIESFENALEGLKREAPPDIPIEVRKGNLLSLYHDIVTEYEQNDTLDEFENYLISIMEDLNDKLDIIRYHSSEQEVAQAFSEIGILLQRSSLTPSQAEMFNKMAEYVDSYGDY